MVQGRWLLSCSRKSQIVGGLLIRQSSEEATVRVSSLVRVRVRVRCIHTRTSQMEVIGLITHQGFDMVTEPP